MTSQNKNLSYKIGKQLAHTSVMRTITFALKTGLVIVLTYFLSPAEYGYYGYIAASINILGAICEFGFLYYLRRQLPAASLEKRQLIWGTCVTFQLYLIGFLILIGFGVWFFLKPQLHLPLTPADQFAILCLLISSILSPTVLCFLNATHQIERYNNILFLETGIWLGLLFVFGAFHPLNFSDVLWAWLLSDYVGLAMAFYHTKTQPLTRPSMKILKETVHYGMPLYFGNLLVISLRYIDRYLIGYFGGIALVGIYHFMISLVSSVDRFNTKIFELVFYPYIFKAHDENQIQKRNKLIALLTKIQILAFLSIFTFLVLAFFTFLPRIFPSEYLQYRGGFLIIALVPLIGILSLPGDMALFFRKNTSYVAFTTASGLVVAVILNVLWIPRFGLYGTAWGMVCGHAVKASAEFYLGKAWQCFDVREFFSFHREKKLLSRIKIDGLSRKWVTIIFEDPL